MFRISFTGYYKKVRVHLLALVNLLCVRFNPTGPHLENVVDFFRTPNGVKVRSGPHKHPFTASSNLELEQEFDDEFVLTLLLVRFPHRSLSIKAFFAEEGIVEGDAAPSRPLVTRPAGSVRPEHAPSPEHRLPPA